MDRDHPSDIFPLDGSTHSFDVVMRGYDRSQVQDVVERLDGELRVAMADKFASAARAAELATHLAGAQAEIEALTSKAQSAGVPNFESMGARISNMLRLAEDEANDIRRIAQEDQSRIQAERDAVAGESARIRSEAQDEARRVMDEAKASSAKTMAEARQHADELIAKAKDAHDKAEAERSARRAKVDEEFELAQKARRAEAARVEQERDQASRRDAQLRVEKAKQQADELVAAADQRLAQLDGRRAEIHAGLSKVGKLLSGLPDLSGSDGVDAEPSSDEPPPENGAAQLQPPQTEPDRTQPARVIPTNLQGPPQGATQGATQGPPQGATQNKQFSAPTQIIPIPRQG